jgi:neutral ceramidase
MSEKGRRLKGPVAKKHQWVNMATRACLPALGYSFGAGTTDGAGEAALFAQGATDEKDSRANPFVQLVVGLLREPSHAQKRCHGVKPILFDTGEVRNIHESFFLQLLQQQRKIGAFCS